MNDIISGIQYTGIQHTKFHKTYITFRPNIRIEHVATTGIANLRHISQIEIDQIIIQP